MNMPWDRIHRPNGIPGGGCGTCPPKRKRLLLLAVFLALPLLAFGSDAPPLPWRSWDDVVINQMDIEALIPCAHDVRNGNHFALWTVSVVDTIAYAVVTRWGDHSKWVFSTTVEPFWGYEGHMAANGMLIVDRAFTGPENSVDPCDFLYAGLPGAARQRI